VKPGQVTDDDVAAFASLLSRASGPVLAFCRTGTRSTTLWALSEAHHLTPDAILAAARSTGYDLESLQPRLAAIHAAARQDSAGAHDREAQPACRTEPIQAAARH
jgi:sulfide:quinone oxidoreductase